VKLSIYPADVDTAQSRLGIASFVGFFFAFRLATSLLCVKLLGADPQTGAAVRIGSGFLLFLVVCFTCLGAHTQKLRIPLRSASLRWTLVLLCFWACSFLWTEAASPAVSFVYWSATAADVATVLLLVRSAAISDVIISLMKGFICGAACIALLAWLLPTQYDLRLGDDDLFNANSICNICALAVFFAQYLMRSKRARLGLITFLLLLTILRSLSKATIAAFVMGQIYLLIQDRSMTRKRKLVLFAAAISVILVFWGLITAYYDVYTTTGNQAETLTGRTAIWSYISGAIIEHPWIGHGFDSMWNVVPVFGTFEARHAENELLEQAYCYGAAGIVLLCGIYGNLLRSIRKMPDHSSRVIFTSIMIYIVVRGLAEAEPFDLLLPLWAIVLIASLAYQDAASPIAIAPAPASGLRIDPQLSSDCHFSS
jgi:O-antigen ligase